MNLLALLLQVSRAAEASVDADEAQQAFGHHRITDMELLLALSQARVECRKAMEMLAARVGELEVAARLVEEQEQAA